MTTRSVATASARTGTGDATDDQICVFMSPVVSDGGGNRFVAPSPVALGENAPRHSTRKYNGASASATEDQ